MSQKITSKNLQFESSLPPFLARLRGQAAVDSDSPDPILAARRRPVKKRSSSEDAEDAPLVVDEEGREVAGVSVGRDGTVTEKEEADATEPQEKTGLEGSGGEDTAREKGGKVAGIGASKKRKLGRVVGGEEEREDSGDPDKRSRGAADWPVGGRTGEVGKRAGAKPRKKAKKIQLSFGDDEGA